MATDVGSADSGDSGPLRSSAVQERAREQAIIPSEIPKPGQALRQLEGVSHESPPLERCLLIPTLPASPLPLGDLNMAAIVTGR